MRVKGQALQRRPGARARGRRVSAPSAHTARVCIAQAWWGNFDACTSRDLELTQQAHQQASDHHIATAPHTPRFRSATLNSLVGCRLFLLANDVPFDEELTSFEKWGGGEKKRVKESGEQPAGTPHGAMHLKLGACVQPELRSRMVLTP